MAEPPGVAEYEEIILKKRTKRESVAYLVGLYFTDRIDLERLKLHIRLLKEDEP